MVEDRVNPYLIDVSTYVGRKVGAAATEPAVLGPHDAFNESLQENMALISIAYATGTSRSGGWCWATPERRCWWYVKGKA